MRAYDTGGCRAPLAMASAGAGTLARRRTAVCGGFTLIELLVAVSIMALMTLLSWRGLDGMTRAQGQLAQRADEVLTLQAGLNQWATDLDAMVQLPQTQALEWDGRALRMTRHKAAVPGFAANVTTNSTANSGASVAYGSSASGTDAASAEGILVVAWARRDIDGSGQWLRWQSPPLKTRGDVQNAWGLAAQWAQNPGDEEKKREVRVGAMAQWQIFFYRGGAWTNPLSSTGTPLPGAAGVLLGIGAPSGVDVSVPDGVRLVMTLPPGQALSGVITRDWVRPTLGGGKS